MATKFLDLNDAAKVLGVTPDQLMEMRQRGDIHGYRDGASWKFKVDEVERVKAEQGGGSGSSDQYSEDFQHLIPAPSPDDDAASGEDSVSILVSEEALGKPPQTSSSTIIGKSGIKTPEDSRLKLSESSEEIGSHLSLDDEAGSSDLKLAADSGVLSGKEMELDKSSGGTSELQLSVEPSSGTLGSGSLAIEGSDLAIGEGSELSLGEDSDELVLGGGGAGSDVSLDPAGSGINLAKPNESGLSLEEPLELGGSQVEALELPEDEDMVSLADAAADPDSATMLKADEEFSLGPQVGSLGEDSSDSGSQVIALEDSEGFDESAATMLAPGEAEVAPLVAVAPGPADLAAAPGAGLGPALVSPAQGPGYAAMPAAPPEAPYSLWNVLGLLCVVMVMSLTGILMVDVLRNMWAFDGTYSVSSSVMDSIIDLLKM